MKDFGNLIELSYEEALALAQEFAAKMQLSDTDKAKIVSHVVEAEMRGYASHGLMRLPEILRDTQENYAGVRNLRVNEGGALLMDCAKAPGIAAVSDLLDIACSKLGNTNVVLASAVNYAGTTGCLGIYGGDLARRGFASIQTCHSVSLVAPYGAIDPVLGTNPYAIAMPGSQHPFVADVATSVRSHGWTRAAFAKGEEIPEGIIQDSEGNPSAVPSGPDFWSLLPMGGYKGYALGLASELICGPVLGGKAGKHAVPGSDGYFAIVFRADFARPLSFVTRECDALFAEVTNARVRPGFARPRIPGHKAGSSKDSVRIPRDLWDRLMAGAQPA